jgi:hypothetical protein
MIVWNWIKTIWRWILAGVRLVFGLGLRTTRMPRWVYQLLHLLIVTTITVVLAIYSRDIVQPSNIATELPQVQDWWCGILFLALYAFVRTIHYFYRLLLMEEASAYPDIDRAWAAGMDALARNGLDIRSIPIFPILGLSEDEETQFFSGARFHARVVAPGIDETPMPLRFFANREALFISCPGVSAVCAQLESGPLLSGGISNYEASDSGAASVATLEPGGPAPGASPGVQQPDVAATGTLAPGQQSLASGLPASAPSETGGTLEPGSAGSAGPAATMLPGGRSSGGAPIRTSGPSEPLSARKLEECRSRLRHLCRLVTRYRQPFCPINGAAIMIPLQWSELSTQSGIDPAKQDVEVLHRGLQMQFPVVCFFNGLNKLEGVREYIQRSSQVDSRFSTKARAGSHFPSGHPVDEGASRWVSGRAVDWFRRWIYSAFAEDLSSSSNPRLYQLLCDLDGRREQLAGFLESVFGGEHQGESIRLSGCYFCGCEPSTRRYEFVKDVMDKLTNEQDQVAWSDYRVWQDHRQRRLTNWMYAAIVVLLLLDAGLLWWKLFGGPPSFI